MNQSNILDNPVSDIGVPALKPTSYKRFLPSLKTLAKKASAKIIKCVNEFADWMMNNVPPRTKTIVSIQKILNLFPKVKLLKTALKDFTKSFEVDIVCYDDPQKQLFATKNIVENKLRLEVKKLNGLKAIITLQITFEKQRGSETITKQAFFNCKTFIICNECINKKMKRNDTIAKLPKRNNKLSTKTSTVNNSCSLSIMPRNCVNFIDS